MKAAYIQSIGGASGDMLLGALLDLGLPLDALREELSRLALDGYHLSAVPDTRREVRGTRLIVSINGSRYLSPRAQLDIVAASTLPERVKAQAAQTLNALWQAESRVHGEDPTALELEELGTVDTLVDVVGFALGLHWLEVAELYAAPLVLGAATPPRWPGGYANPAPATLELAALAGAPTTPELPGHRGAGELTTPTGAAIITALARFERPAMSIAAIGVGLGSKDPERFPNVVRIWLGERDEPPSAPDPAGSPAYSDPGEGTLVAPVAKPQAGIVLLETNLDDVTGEVLGYAQERLFALGALDVWHTPVQMKKNRPGVILSALLPQSLEAAAVELILRETPTLGVRRRPVERYAAEREVIGMETDQGSINVKVKSLAGTAVAAAPEYEDCRRIALATGRPLLEVYRQAEAEARRRFLSP